MDIRDYLNRDKKDFTLSQSDAEDLIEQFKYEKMEINDLTDKEFKMLISILKKCSNQEITYFITWSHMQYDLRNVDITRYKKLTKTFPKAMKKIDKVLKRKKVKKLKNDKNDK